MTREKVLLCLAAYALIGILFVWCAWRLLGETFEDPERRRIEDQEQADWLAEWERRR